MQDLSYFWSLQQSSFSYLSEMAFRKMIQALLFGLERLPDLDAPSDTDLKHRQVLLTAATALLAQLAFLAPHAVKQEASHALMRFVGALAPLQSPDVYRQPEGTSGKASSPAKGRSDAAAGALEQLILYLVDQSPAPLAWLQV